MWPVLERDGALLFDIWCNKCDKYIYIKIPY